MRSLECRNEGAMTMKKLLILCIFALTIAVSTGCNAINSSGDDAHIVPLPNPLPEGITWEEALEERGEWTEEVLELYTQEIHGIKLTQADPTQTGDLIIYMPPNSIHMNPIVNLYRQKYPNVNLIVETPGATDFTAYTTRLTTELAAGKGPDILFPGEMLMADINSLADNGTFLDLNEFIEQDENFDLDDYVRGVLDSGLFRGKRYIIPRNFGSVVYVASTKTLDEIGFDRSQTGDIISFLNEAVRCLPKAQEIQNFRSMFNGALENFLWLVFEYELVDFETGTVFPNEEALEELLNAYKSYYHISSDESRRVWPLRPNDLINGTVIFDAQYGISNFFGQTSSLKTRTEDYEMFVIPGIDGKLHAWSFMGTLAIRSGSPNAQNAWNFIKLILSPEVQSNSFSTGQPVHKASLIAQVEYYHNYFDGPIMSDGGENIIRTKLSEVEKQAYLNMLLNVDGSFVYNSRPIRRMFGEHMTPFLKGEVSYETAVAGLRNQLRLYISELF
jgi:multiple sugar transport system substrate-binding protein